MLEPIQTSLSIERVELKDAKNYSKDYHIGLNIEKAVVVEKGMKNGKPSVDLVCIDDIDKKYVIMITGSLIESLATVIKVSREKHYDRDVDC